MCSSTASESLTNASSTPVNKNSSLVEKEPTLSVAEMEQREQQRHQPLILKTVSGLCHQESPFEDLRQLGEAIKSGDSLAALPISGGKTNYSYKVHLVNDPKKAVFCKICLSKVSWSPDPMSLERTDTEFQMMQSISKALGADEQHTPIATPYHLIDVTDDCKIVVTEWAKVCTTLQALKRSIISIILISEITNESLFRPMNSGAINSSTDRWTPGSLHRSRDAWPD